MVKIMNRSIMDQIREYVPKNMQEERDKEYILEAYETFPNIFVRENDFIHFTASALVVNKERTKALMIFHNIYNSWAWVGGHADGEEDLLAVALREVEEETSVKNIKVLGDGKIMTIDALPVAGHIKRGKYVSSHVHLSAAYIFEADENEPIHIKPDENSQIAWVPLDKVVELSTEPHMKPAYQKLVDIAKTL